MGRVGSAVGMAQPRCQQGRAPSGHPLLGPPHLFQVGDSGRSSLEVQVDQPHFGGTDIPGDLLLLLQGGYLCCRELQNLALGDDVLDDVTCVPPEAAVLADVLVQLQGKAAGSGAGMGVSVGLWGHQLPAAPGTTQTQPRGCHKPRPPPRGPAVTSPVTEEELDASQGHEEQHDEAQQVQPVAPLEGHLWELWGHTRGLVLRGQQWPEGPQARVSPPSPTYRDPEKGDTGAAPPASLLPTGDVWQCPACPSYLVCPSAGPGPAPPVPLPARVRPGRWLQGRSPPGIPSG